MSDGLAYNDEDYDLPHYDGEYLHFYAGATGEFDQNESVAVRVFFLWSPTDPLMLQVHVHIAHGSVRITPEEYPLDNSEQSILCNKCEAELPYDSFGVLVAAAEDDLNFDEELWCLMCADDTQEIMLSESAWAVSLDSVKAACGPTVVEPAPAGMPIRLWRESEDLLEFIFSDGEHTLDCHVDVEYTILMLKAIDAVIRDKFSEAPLSDNYLSKGLDDLEAFLSNN